MKVKEFKNIINECDDDAEVYISLYCFPGSEVTNVIKNSSIIEIE